jgi:hypothetical protein
MSVKCFAEKPGKDRSTVYNIFKQTSIDPDTLVKISKILDYIFFFYFVMTKTKAQEIFPHLGQYGKILCTNIFFCRNIAVSLFQII